MDITIIKSNSLLTIEKISTRFTGKLMNYNQFNLLHHTGNETQYVPDATPAGRQFSRFHVEGRYTTAKSERLAHLPLWYDIEARVQHADH